MPGPSSRCWTWKLGRAAVGLCSKGVANLYYFQCEKYRAIIISSRKGNQQACNLRFLSGMNNF